MNIIEKINKLRYNDSNFIFRPEWVLALTLVLTFADGLALSGSVGSDSNILDSALTVIIVILALCLVLNLLPVLLARLNRSFNAGFSNISSREYRVKVGLILATMMIILSSVIWVRIANTTVRMEEDLVTVNKTAQILEEDEAVSEPQAPIEEKQTPEVPQSTMSKAAAMALEPLATSVFNYFINWLLYDPLIEEKRKIDRALARTEKEIDRLRSDEEMLSIDVTPELSARHDEIYSSYLQQCASENNEVRFSMRLFLGKKFGYSPDQWDSAMAFDNNEN